MAEGREQLALFEPSHAEGETSLPSGWAYRAGFIDKDEEQAVLAGIERLELQGAVYKSYIAKRRVAHFGSSYDFDSNQRVAAPPLPAFLEPLRVKAAEWIGEPPAALVSALVAEYHPGVPLGWHRDVPDFETVVGVSLLGTGRMRFRRYPPKAPKKEDVVSLALAPRSAYVLRAEARWAWQHSIAAGEELRYSVTFRTARWRSGGDRRST